MDIETELAQCLDRGLTDCPKNLSNSIRYSLLAPGKRIRPRILLTTGEMLGENIEKILPTALALEMIHCFTLIHDDLPCMDDDDYRRGKPSNHKVHGEAIALLAGDALIPLAIETFLKAAPVFEPSYFQKALQRLLSVSGPRGVVAGQSAEFLLGKGATLEDLKKMHALKTGALFEAAVLIPKDLLGIEDNSPQGKALQDFGSSLGEAFQVADDFEDREKEQGSLTSVLSYQSEQEAALTVLSKMDRAIFGLREHWSEKSDPLLKIANELIERIHGGK